MTSNDLIYKLKVQHVPDLVSSTESVNFEDQLSIPHATPFVFVGLKGSIVREDRMGEPDVC